MCLLIAKPAGIALPADWEDICSLASEANPDGVGFSIATPDTRPKIFRSISIDSIDFAAKSAKHCLTEVDAIIHFRFGTSGGTKKELCHPFQIYDGSAFAHNGILPIKPDPGLSDTAQVANECATAEQLREALRPHASRGNKFAVLPIGGALEIIGEEFGYWDSGIWFSNDTWKAYGGLWGSSRYDDCEYTAEDLHFEDVREIEDSLSAVVSRYGWNVVNEMIQIMKPDEKPRRKIKW